MVKNIIKVIALLVLFTTSMQAEGWKSYLPTINFTKAKNTLINASQTASHKELATLTSLMTFTFSTVLSYYCVNKLFEDAQGSQDFKSTSSESTSPQSTPLKKFGWATGAGLSFLTALGSIVYSNSIF